MDNFHSRDSCRRCKKRKPSDAGAQASDMVEGQVVGNLVAAGNNGEGVGHDWREVLDDSSKQMYYYNITSMETTWDRPKEMGPAPHATGWFGRGEAGSKAGKVYTDQNESYLKRPARKQKEHIEASNSRLEGNENYNIWYDKYSGENWNPADRGKEPAENRCVMGTDAGRTKADKHGSSSRYFCIQFCRGKCARGVDCTWFHRIPTAVDDGMLDELHDCFGRERHATHKDDMGGAGSFTQPSRTLYVGRLRPDQHGTTANLDKEIKSQFGEFGEVEHINLISSKNIAFVRYRFRSAAEFGKEAMANQSMGKGEVLNVKWARDDPNPVAQEAIKRADADAAMAALARRGVEIGGGGQLKRLPEAEAEVEAEAEAEAEEEGSIEKWEGDIAMPAKKKHKFEVVGGGESYPDTDLQYSEK
mgnify:CR=1 FL=1